MDETNEFDYLDQLCDFAQFSTTIMEYYQYNIGYGYDKMNTFSTGLDLMKYKHKFSYTHPPNMYLV